jgi:hypothetical protein
MTHLPEMHVNLSAAHEKGRSLTVLKFELHRFR